MAETIEFSIVHDLGTSPSYQPGMINRYYKRQSYVSLVRPDTGITKVNRRCFLCGKDIEIEVLSKQAGASYIPFVRERCVRLVRDEHHCRTAYIADLVLKDDRAPIRQISGGWFSL